MVMGDLHIFRRLSPKSQAAHQLPARHVPELDRCVVATFEGHNVPSIRDRSGATISPVGPADATNAERAPTGS